MAKKAVASLQKRGAKDFTKVVTAYHYQTE